MTTPVSTPQHANVMTTINRDMSNTLPFYYVFLSLVKIREVASNLSRLLSIADPNIQRVCKAYDILRDLQYLHGYEERLKELESALNVCHFSTTHQALNTPAQDGPSGAPYGRTVPTEDKPLDRLFVEIMGNSTGSPGPAVPPPSSLPVPLNGPQPSIPNPHNYGTFRIFVQPPTGDALHASQAPDTNASEDVQDLVRPQVFLLCSLLD